jgi:hypothetical protein
MADKIGLSTGAKVGIAIAAISIALISISLAIFFCRRRNRVKGAKIAERGDESPLQGRPVQLEERVVDKLDLEQQAPTRTLKYPEGEILGGRTDGAR